MLATLAPRCAHCAHFRKQLALQALLQRIPPTAANRRSASISAASRDQAPMASTSYKYVIVGGGNASGYAAREFAAQGVAPGELCIITDEPVVAYERPALSKGYLMGAAKLPGFHTCVGAGGERQGPDWYESKGITYKTSSKVTAVDVAAKSVTLEGGSSIKYDKLILATGAKPVLLSDFKTPGADLAGVHYLRNEAEAAGLLKAIQDIKESGGQAVIIGGGYIGMEVAAGLASNGVSTTMVFPEDKLLARLLTPKLAEFYESYYASKGVKMIKNATVTSLIGKDGKVTHAVAKSRTENSEQQLPASLVVVGVGARPNSDLVAGQLELADRPVGGIKVDGHFRTSNPDVYAIGDIAAFPLLRDGGKLVRQEHVTHCRSSAAHAVQAILGKVSEPYDYLPYFYSREFDLSWQFWGSQGDDSTEIIHFENAAGKPGAYWVSGGKIIGVFLESGSPEENAAAKKLAQEQPAVSSDIKDLGIKFATLRV